ncbi:MAG: VCBS repeat-containing protein [candidate division WOR-3 bacterium]|nr:VCBS repeat-containing protein [candidate division WOR-3 bacterium]
MNRRAVVVAAAVLLVGGLALGQLGYVECSTGFQGDPVLDGGRTELEFADINNDGNIDILSIGDHGNPHVNTDEHGVMVWFGDGYGNWSVFQYGEFGYGGIAVGDVNGDGHWDIGYGMHHNYSGVDLGDDMLEVALGDGTGQTWTAWDDSLVPGGSVWGMFSTDFADVDNDGDLDIGSTSFGYGVGLRVFLNQGDGTWSQSFGTPESVNSNMEFYFRDVNRDGNADIISATGGPAVYFGDGAGGFTPGDTGLPQSDYGLSGLSPGDVDNDGGCDVAFANDGGGVEVWTFDDTASRWQSFSGTLPTTGEFEGTQLCDMNADGFVDVCALGGGHTKVWLGNGQGNWTEAADITTPSPGYYSAFRTGADFDHNGYPDIVLITEEGSWPSYHNVAHAFRETSAAESLTMFPVFPRGGEKFANGSVQFIDWWSAAHPVHGDSAGYMKLELSTTGPSGPWQDICVGVLNNGRFQWKVPDWVRSSDCYIRYFAIWFYTFPPETAIAITPRAFTIGDTVLGVAESRKPQASSPKPGATVVRGVLVLGVGSSTSPSTSILLDIGGRKVLDLKPGANDVSRLSPGVYFVRQVSGLKREASSVTKVVLTR